MAESQNKLLEAIQKGLEEHGYNIVRLLSQKHQASPSASRVYLTDYKGSEKVSEHSIFEQKTSEQRAVKLYSVFMLDDVNGIRLDKLDERSQREVDIMKKVAHPNIPAFKEAFRFPFLEFGAIDALAMQYINAPNLLQRLTNKERVSEEEARNILRDTLYALNHVHTELGEQVVHRDIKPSNILFSGHNAYLFDFNFSKIGERTSNTTQIDNFGYYPSDVYSGRQTPSQDLVALGNTIIAMGYGLEISDVREKQGKNGLEAVSVDDLNFSPKLKRFLRKLTAENPAFRYQTAKQAGSDLQRLDEITEIELENRTTTIMRSEGLQRLLLRLEKEDRLFNYNVPPNIRDGYDDDSLVAHLEKTYKRTQFIIENPDEIAKYVQQGDRVVCKTDLSDYAVKKGSKCRFKEIKGDKVIVKFENGTKVEVEPLDLFVVQEGKNPVSVLEYSRKEIRRSMFIRDSGYTELKGLEALTKKTELLYEGKPISGGRYTLPKGAEGLVVYKYRDKDLSIVFENKPGVKYEWWFSERGLGSYRYFKPEQLNLIVKNYIDYDKLQKECFSEPTAEIKNGAGRGGALTVLM